MKIRSLLVIASVAFVLSGCSTLHYTAQDQPMINLKPVEGAQEDFQYEDRYNFFLWGLTPGEVEVDVTKIALENGAPNGLSEVRIEEKVTFVDGLLNAITLGIYAPRTVTVEGKVIQGGAE